MDDINVRINNDQIDQEKDRKISVDNVHSFNNDQINHNILVQECVLTFCQLLMKSAINHDSSKFSKEEYEAFVEARPSLRNSKDGKDEEYTKHYKSKAIQHHVLNNPHHPEYWTDKNDIMPLHEIIIMFFDWYSRSISSNSGTMDNFWDYNLEKLIGEQDHAIPVVKTLREMYDREFSLHQKAERARHEAYKNIERKEYDN